jgi:hypothetical protein
MIQFKIIRYRLTNMIRSPSLTAMKRRSTSKSTPRLHLSAYDLTAATAGKPVDDGTPIPALRREPSLPAPNGTPLPA